ncbi:hypothetical protein B5V01_27790 [Mesorhizobium erdmanii]|uniref:Exopolysaccharide production repressor exox n=2 Tax=Mesorhizobium TaxID=68287 RepID=A0A3M9WZN4_9HYPH|nr:MULTISPECIES: hypothetical protein [Mesorhizobium]RNJ41277.1 hypothetical protein DNR46_35095 [Mesorhizobium japonicum]RXT37920.1 hypothetical protein B5V01_27790 [Mesorhizobium erdmanii]
MGSVYFPRFLVGATATLLVISGWIYYSTGSIWHALVWAAAVAVILQAGYFLCVGFLIYRGVSAGAEISQSADEPLEDGDLLSMGRDGGKGIFPPT